MEYLELKYYRYKLGYFLMVINVLTLNAGNHQELDIQYSQLGYQEFHSMETVAFEAGNFGELETLIKEHLKKAKNEKNNLEIARAYYYKTLSLEPSKALQYADSIINVTKDISHQSYPTLGYALKGHLLYNKGNFSASLDNYLTAYHLALQKENFQQEREISLAIAAIRNIKGQHYAALELYRRSLFLLEKETDFETNYEEYVALLYNLSLSHLRLTQIDSSKFYVNKGFNYIMTLKDWDSWKDFALLDAQINFYNKDYKRSKDTLIKYLHTLKGTEKAIKLYYMGKIEDEIGTKKEAINYYTEIDSIVTETGDPFNEVGDVYQQLMMYSVLKEDKIKQVEYIGKLIKYDSILSAGQEEILNKTTRSFDIPYLKFQKKKVEEQLKAKNASIYFITVLAGMGILSGFHFRSKAKNSRKKLELLIEKGLTVKPLGKKNIIGGQISSIPEDIRKDILNKLDVFEKSDRYLDKDMDLVTLAEYLQTNTSYLSGTINYHKELSFPNYLKVLRINKAIEQLKVNPELLKYNYQGLADTFGFKTGESFSQAFKKKTGVHPSQFLNELKSRKLNRGL